VTILQRLGTIKVPARRYASLVANYRPMVQKADLGASGIWYRLLIGPIRDKVAAAKLCSELKSQGWPDCLVRPARVALAGQHQ
jgi:hypothetical protein